MGLARIHLTQGNAESAIDLARLVLQTPKAPIFPRVAAAEVILSVQGPAEGLKAFRELESSHPDSALVHASLARALFVADDHAAAAHHMRTATDLEPDNIQYLSALADLYTALQRFADAEEVRKRLSELMNRQQPR
jgi:predicted Zn-dependent protease